MYLLGLLISQIQPLVPFLGDEREEEAARVVVEIKRVERDCRVVSRVANVRVAAGLEDGFRDWHFAVERWIRVIIARALRSCLAEIYNIFA